MNGTRRSFQPQRITRNQFLLLRYLASRRGLDFDELRDAAGGNVTDLSREEADALIEMFRGTSNLPDPNPPDPLGLRRLLRQKVTA